MACRWQDLLTELTDELRRSSSLQVVQGSVRVKLFSVSSGSRVMAAIHASCLVRSTLDVYKLPKLCAYPTSASLRLEKHKTPWQPNTGHSQGLSAQLESLELENEKLAFFGGVGSADLQ